MIIKNPHVLENPTYKYVDHYKRNIFEYDLKPETYNNPHVNGNYTLLDYIDLSLFIVELEFLTYCCLEIEKNNWDYKSFIVIYIGAAPGKHLSMLINLFSLFEYVFIDPKEFEFGKITVKAKLNFINKFANPDLCKKLKKKYINKKILFICDLSAVNVYPSQNNIREDLAKQYEFFYILKPYKSLLRLFFPYCDSFHEVIKIKYLKGIELFQPYSGICSHKVRLLVNNNYNEKYYNIYDFNGKLVFFNKHIRTNCINHSIDYYGIDHCWDCFTYINALENYLKVFQKYLTIEDFLDAINNNLELHRIRIEFYYAKQCYKINYMEYKANLKSNLLKKNKISCDEAIKYYFNKKNKQDTSYKETNFRNLSK